MINPPDFSFIQIHLSVIEENLEELEKPDPKMARPELSKNILESFKALGEINLTEMEPEKLHVVHQKLSSLHERVEDVFGKHVMPKEVEEIREQLEKVEEQLPKIDFTKALPDETIVKIFSYTPEDRKTLRGVSTKFKAITDDEQLTHFHADTRLRNLQEAFKNEKGFSDRWDAHMKIVELRLKKSEKDPTPMNKYEELLRFQAERFPQDPFEDDSDLYTVEGFLEREKIIKNWNTFLFAKSAFPDKDLSEPVNKEELEKVCKEVKTFNLQRRTKIFAEIGLTEIPEEVNRLGHFIYRLSFADNKISYIPKNCFSGLTSLKVLALHHNQLTAIDKETFSGLTSLEWINLSNNQLTAIDKETFSGLTSLRQLRLHNNQLTAIDKETFSGLTSLEELGLHCNQLTAIDKETFSGLTSLEWINLSNNQLTAIDKETFSGLTSLQWLKLSNNQLTAIDDETRDSLKSIIQIEE